MGDAKNDLFQKMDVDLTEGAATIIPIDDIYHVGFAGNAADIV